MVVPEPDNDKDGFLDEDDACPNRPETKNNFQDDDGCPDKLPQIVVEEGEVTLPEPIEFELNKAVILPESFAILKALVKVLDEHPDIQLLSVEGHASDEGTDRYNLILSRRRAQAVLQYLVENGVETWRLQAKGFGKTRPLFPNDTEEHRHLNRRVEFIIVERSITPEVKKKTKGGGKPAVKKGTLSKDTAAEGTPDKEASSKPAKKAPPKGSASKPKPDKGASKDSKEKTP